MALMTRFVLYGVVGYALLIVFVFFWQRRLLYHPPNDLPLPMHLQAAGLRFWPNPGTAFRGYVALDSAKNKSGTVVVFHGNAGAAWQRDGYVKALQPLGYRVVLAEYPGYGGRPGQKNEKCFVADAKETMKLAVAEFGAPLFLFGESLGCGVATGATVDSAIPIEGIALFTPWDTLSNLAQRIYWFLPARWLARDKYDNVRNILGYRGRVAVIVAGQDEVLPKTLGLKLYEALNNRKRLWIVENAGHNTWMEKVSVSWWKEIMDFLAKD